ncbi:hypothetical protein KEJ39_09655 [Candidatus Bathyarchaeota archaeon]|nr:hypothetical protein [Candidatus Bathyarchaeota archaeon]
MSLKEGHSDSVSLAGLLISVILLGVLFYVSLRSPIEPDPLSRFSSDFAEISPEVDISTSKYLWTERTLDVIIQAILVFGTAACCITMLRPEKGSVNA